MGVPLPWKKMFNNSRMVGNFLWNFGNNNKVPLETFLALSKTGVWDISACGNCDFCAIIVFYALWQHNFVWKYLLMTFFSKAEMLKDKMWNSNGILADWFWGWYHIYFVIFTSNICFHDFLPTFHSTCQIVNISKMVNIFSRLLCHFTLNEEFHRATSGLRDNCIGRILEVSKII